MSDVLDTLAEDIAVLVAMRADESALGLDGDYEKVDAWGDRLAEALDDGLESAYERVNAHGE